MHVAPLSLLLVLAAIPASAAVHTAQGQVWVVAPAPGPGVDATSVDDALALAGDGDLILVRGQATAAFAPFTVDGLSVTIQGDPSATIRPDPRDPGHPAAVTVRNLAAGKPVMLNGLQVQQVESASAAVRVHDNLGPVVLDAVAVDGGATAVEVADSVSVAFESCWLSSSPIPTGAAAEGKAGLDVLRSSVFLDSCLVSGPPGFDASERGGRVFAAGDGGPGVRLRGSTLTLTAGEIAGGGGGHVTVGCSPGGDGGDGIVADQDLGVPSLVRRNEGLIVGTLGGLALTGCSPPGEKGAAIVLVAGSVEELPQAVRYVFVEPLVKPDDFVELVLIGQVGDLAFLAVGPAPEPGLFLAGLQLTAHVSPAAILPLGPILQQVEMRTLPTPPLPLGVEFVGFTVQALYLGAGEVFLTGPNGLSIVE